MTSQSSLAELIEWLGRDRERFDEDFARDLAHELHAHAQRLELPVVERLGLVDVVVTFYMDRRMRLVVTGWLPDVPGEVSIRWDEDDFPQVPVALLDERRTSPYAFATLDFGYRGRIGTLKRPAANLPTGLEVRVRALATIGGQEEFRVRAHGIDASVPPSDLELHEAED